MITDIAPVPDLLRRFVPTPFVFDFFRNHVCGRIESNDLEIALAIREFRTRPGQVGPQQVRLWKIIRDEGAVGGGEDLTMLSDGPLRTLLMGSGTMIVFDRERGEVLGFLAVGVSTEQLTLTLIPLLFNADAE